MPTEAKIPAGSLEGYMAPMANPGLFEHGLSIVRTWTADLRELKALLPKLAPIPTLLMWGSKDPAVYVSSMEPLARHFEHVQTVVFPGIGHLPYEECPEEFNRALIQFPDEPGRFGLKFLGTVLRERLSTQGSSAAVASGVLT